MQQTYPVSCANCNNNQLLLKYEVTYEYSYVLDANAPGEYNRREFLPYLYDNREQKLARQYIECTNCGATFPCFFNEWDNGRDENVFQNAINVVQEN